MPTADQITLHFERVILGALLTAEDPGVSAVVAGLHPEDFTIPAHRALYWRLVIDAIEPETDPDLAAALQPVGGADYLTHLANAPHPAGGVLEVAAACGAIRRGWAARCERVAA